MAVDLPVPVAPMSLKCLVSSRGAIATPASVTQDPQRGRRRAARHCAPRPDSSLTPRRYVSCGLARTHATQAPSPAIAAAATEARCSKTIDRIIMRVMPQ